MSLICALAVNEDNSLLFVFVSIHSIDILPNECLLCRKKNTSIISTLCFFSFVFFTKGKKLLSFCDKHYMRKKKIFLKKENVAIGCIIFTHVRSIDEENNYTFKSVLSTKMILFLINFISKYWILFYIFSKFWSTLRGPLSGRENR